MKKMMFAAIALSACATTGRSLPTSTDTPLGIKLPLDQRAQTDDATEWFPALQSAADLPSAARLERELLAQHDAFPLGVKVCVGPDGGVTGVEIARSSGSAALDEAALRDISSWRYESFRAPAQVRVCKPIALTYHPARAVATSIP